VQALELGLVLEWALMLVLVLVLESEQALELGWVLEWALELVLVLVQASEQGLALALELVLALAAGEDRFSSLYLPRSNRSSKSYFQWGSFHEYCFHRSIWHHSPLNNHIDSQH